jgi:hypothetical protein
VPLADISDVTTHLPLDRIPTVSSDVSGYQLSVERTIKAYLVGVYTPATLATWATPDSTPAEIREVAGKMIAGLRYRQRTSEENPGGIEDITYGQRLYNEAMATLNDIRQGVAKLVDVTDGSEIATDTGVGPSFFPNDNAPVFTMGAAF